MVNSEQKKELGEEWFGKLQEEVTVSTDDSLQDFLAIVRADSMGFDGKEGVDAD